MATKTKKPLQTLVDAANLKGPEPETKAKATKKAPAKQKVSQRNTESLPLDLAPSPTPSALVMVPLDAIAAGNQVRTEFDAESLAELAADIAARGILQPILLRANTGGAFPFLIIAGERRYRAARLAGLAAIPAIIGEADDLTATCMQIAENIQREDLSLKDTTNLVQQVFEQTGSVTKAAEQLHKSKAWVSKHLAAGNPDLNWRARRLLEDGITKDLEIVLTIDKLINLDWSEGTKMFEDVAAGTAGRQTVREAYERVKAEIAEQEGKIAAKDEKTEGTEEDPFKETAAAQNEALRRQQEKREREQREKARHDDPTIICRTITWNAETVPGEREQLDAEQYAILAQTLRGHYEAGQAAATHEATGKLVQMMYSIRGGSLEYTELELVAFFSGYAGEPFNHSEMINRVTTAIEEMCA